jgi:hypothetical protein
MESLGKSGFKSVFAKKDPIKHEPFLTPTGIGAKAQSSEDWITRLAHSRVKDVMIEGATMGWESDASDSGSPIPRFITGEY